jgi:hypothetical protein
MSKLGAALVALPPTPAQATQPISSSHHDLARCDAAIPRHHLISSTTIAIDVTRSYQKNCVPDQCHSKLE